MTLSLYNALGTARAMAFSRSQLIFDAMKVSDPAKNFSRVAIAESDIL